MKLCIITYDFPHPHHTMVNAHVRGLFGGNTSVCCWTKRGEFDRKVPVLALSEIRPGWAGWLLRPTNILVDLLCGVQKRRVFGQRKTAAEEFLKEEKVDVILCEFGSVGTALGRALLDFGVPVFCYFRGQDASEKLNSKRQVRAYRKYFPKFSGIFSVSHSLVENLARVDVVHPNTHVLPSGVDTLRFAPGEKVSGSFVAIGRLIAKKRPDITIRAFCRAAQSNKDATLTVIGGGEMQRECETIVGTEGMTGRVHFLGEQSHQTVCEYLAKSEFFLQHSVTSPSGDTEGTPTSIQEALSSGCVVISTRHAGIPDLIIEGETGFLVAEQDEVAFCARITDAMEGRFDVGKMAQNSRDYALEHLDTTKLYRQLEEIMSAEVR